jgi:hypothetical protein
VRTREDYRRELDYWRRDAAPARERAACPVCGRDGIVVTDDGLWPHYRLDMEPCDAG